MPRLKKEIVQSYQEIFPEMPAKFLSSNEEKAPHLGRYILFDGLLMLCFALYNIAPWFALWCFLISNLLWAIIRLDWQYRLISPNLCLWLFCLGLLGAHWQFTPLQLAESLESALIYFGFFYFLYQAARFIFRQEALGQGDYWLALGLGAFLPLGALPYFLLTAALLGILTFLIYRQRHAPFAPALCCAMLALQISYF